MVMDSAGAETMAMVCVSLARLVCTAKMYILINFMTFDRILAANMRQVQLSVASSVNAAAARLFPPFILLSQTAPPPP
jgi:hypothetical protein